MRDVGRNGARRGGWPAEFLCWAAKVHVSVVEATV